MGERTGIFAGDDPFALAAAWLEEARATEPNDANAIALATVDAAGLPDVRMVLLKSIDAATAPEAGFVFYTNYDSAKAREIAATGTAAFVMHWKSLRRQIRVRGTVTREDGAEADAYFASRAVESRIGAWASHQSRPRDSRETLLAEVAAVRERLGDAPPRPAFWGGFRIRPVEIEFWADGAFRLHDRFRWARDGEGEQVRGPAGQWGVMRLDP